jgi:hypothetical protein
LPHLHARKAQLRVYYLEKEQCLVLGINWELRLTIPHRASGYTPAKDGIMNPGYINMTIPFSAGADLEMKRKALDSANGPQPTQAPTPALSSSLIEWLEAL